MNPSNKFSLIWDFYMIVFNIVILFGFSIIMLFGFKNSKEINPKF